MLRLLVLSDRYPPHITGGYETACANVVEALKGMGVELRVLTSNFGIGRRRREGHVWRVLHRPQDSYRLIELARWEREDLATVMQVLTEFRPSVIYVWSMLQLFVTLHLVLADSGVPVVFNIQDLWLPTQVSEGKKLHQAWLDKSGSWVKRLLKRVRLKAAARYVPAVRQLVSLEDISLRGAVFGSVFRQIQHRDSGFDTTGSRVIYNGVDTRRFRPGTSSTRPECVRLLTTGRFVHEKGLHTVIEAIELLLRKGFNDVTLTVAGFPAYPWEYAEGLRRAIKAVSGAQITLTEKLDDDDMPQLYRDHDVFVFPSIGPEGFPMAVLEAMASGCCVIGTQTGGTGEILEHEKTGLTFEPGNAAMLADTIARVRSNQMLASRLGERARAVVAESFNTDLIARQNLEHLRHLVGS